MMRKEKTVRYTCDRCGYTITVDLTDPINHWRQIKECPACMDTAGYVKEKP